MKIVIAGATGFIGRYLVKELKNNHQVIALSRTKRAQSQGPIEWKQLDLFSMSATKEALKGADIAIYLIHSMAPNSRLIQSSFENNDLIIADNFSRAAQENGVKQIVYLGGIVPKGKKISKHLKSRFEVEKVLASRGTALTSLRAGMVVGPSGSSYTILEKLVKRLPLMVLPNWTKSKTEVIGIWDLLKVFKEVIGNESYYNRSLDITNRQTITYEQMLRFTAKALNKKRIFIPVPINSLSFSKLWVAKITGGSYELTSPLIESLRYDILADEKNPQIEELIEDRDFISLVKKVQNNIDPLKRGPKVKIKAPPRPNTVLSVQRYEGIGVMDANEIANHYMEFLPYFFKSLIHVKIIDGSICNFHIRLLKKPILQLTHVPERSNPDRHLFYITGGILVKRINHGWLEVRQVLNKEITLMAIHEFLPALPWFIYVNTQAKFHLYVMNQFRKYLLRAVPRNPSS
jgi:uncharacterized protein YbjT (DUF2867 family)